MSWFLFALSGYFLYAFVTVINKYLLKQHAVTKPFVFTFWVGVLSVFTFVLAPFGLHWPGLAAFLLDILVGVIYYFAIRFFYEALDINEASRAASLVGGLTPIFVLLLSLAVLGEALTGMQLLAFLLLVAGGLLISINRGDEGLKKGMKGIRFIALAILLAAIYWIAAKYVFDQQGFITGFVWSRLGFVLMAASLLVKSSWRREIFASGQEAGGKLSVTLLSSKLIAGFGSLFVHLALSKGSASLTNALQGTEYVFLLALTIILSKKYPQLIKEKGGVSVILQKIVAVLLIAGGLAILTV